MKRRYLVYKVTNRFDGKIYIGCHSTLNKNDRYMGSGVEIKQALKQYGRKSFIKEILFDFDTKEDMLAKEKELVTKDFCTRQDTYNRIEGGGTYLTLGMIHCKDVNNNYLLVYSDDPRWLSGELVGVTKNTSHPNRSLLNKDTMPVRDKDGNCFKVKVDDPRVILGELVHVKKDLPGNCQFKGKHHRQDSKDRIGRANSESQKGELNSQYGKPRSEEFKQKMRDKFSISFFVYDLDGNFISKENNITKYAADNNLNPSSIVKALKGSLKTTGGFKFSYDNK